MIIALMNALWLQTINQSIKDIRESNGSCATNVLVVTA